MRIVVIGEGLTGALEGAEVVVDVSNSQTFEDAAAREFFTSRPPTCWPTNPVIWQVYLASPPPSSR